MAFLLEAHILIWILIAAVIAISVLVEIERGGWATTIFCLSIALIFWRYWADVFNWISQNPTGTLLFIIFYTLSGIIWSIIKWKSYISKYARAFHIVKENFIKKYGQIADKWNLWIDWLKDNRYELSSGYVSFDEKDTPEDIAKRLTISATSNKGLIVSWIAYWPMSIASTLLNDPVRRFMNWIYDRISGVFQRMSENSANNMIKGMEKHEPEDKGKSGK
jgi:hypothetical protein